MLFGRNYSTNVPENKPQRRDGLTQQDNIHICLQSFEHNEQEKCFSGKKIFLMCEQLYTKEMSK